MKGTIAGLIHSYLIYVSVIQTTDYRDGLFALITQVWILLMRAVMMHTEALALSLASSAGYQRGVLSGRHNS